ncbi:YqeG family HAD IIIA-type phosphatase [Anaerolentibacter hominis]|uniref:YqeG family HAD IIIA-type phosphatase n=1 Tax=Anaerolentibacter hominis TaxID=3079009 RepID=UPI0031B84FA8
MLKTFYPDEYLDSAYVIDYEALFREGYRGIIFDIDNTLVEHGADASRRSVELMKRLKNLGFGVCLLSNNQQERVERFNRDAGVSYIYNAHKPARSGYERAMKVMGTELSNTVFIGDQLFTDVWGAKRMGMRSILVKPISPKEEIQIVLKRKLERIVLHFYRKSREN